jgi:formate--tetrahydrofolate ligase
MHAVTAAHNMLAAMLDNHLFQGNALGLDLNEITWRRVLDVNDRALRNIVIGLGPKADGVTRQTGFDITAASEVMATLALSSSLADSGGGWPDRRGLYRRGLPAVGGTRPQMMAVILLLT